MLPQAESVCGSVRVLRCVRSSPITSLQVDAMSLIETTEDTRYNPLDLVEQVATHHDWTFERNNDDEVTLVVAGRWTEYQLSFTWMNDLEALHLACAFDLRVPAHHRSEVVELVSMVNEQLWIGHFDFWNKDGLVMFRQALMLTGGAPASDGQCEAMLAMAVEACEQYYQAFQYVVWAGKSAREALDAIMFETSGEA
jgi:hypothetical protein